MSAPSDRAGHFAGIAAPSGSLAPGLSHAVRSPCALRAAARACARRASARSPGRPAPEPRRRRLCRRQRRAHARPRASAPSSWRATSGHVRHLAVGPDGALYAALGRGGCAAASLALRDRDGDGKPEERRDVRPRRRQRRRAARRLSLPRADRPDSPLEARAGPARARGRAGDRRGRPPRRRRPQGEEPRVRFGDHDARERSAPPPTAASG